MTLLFELVYQNERIVSFGSFNERNEQVNLGKDLFIYISIINLCEEQTVLSIFSLELFALSVIVFFTLSVK